MRIEACEAGAMIIDIQDKIMKAMDAKEACMERALMLIRGLKVLDIPMIITQQYTKGLGNTNEAVYEAAGSREFFDKRTFSCCQDQAIMDAVRAMNKKYIIILGIEAHVCVLQTCIDLKAAGYQPVLVLDAITSRKAADKEIGIQRAMQEGVLVTSAESLLFELTVDSKHPKFKEISALVK